MVRAESERPRLLSAPSALTRSQLTDVGRELHMIRLQAGLMRSLFFFVQGNQTLGDGELR